MLKHINRYLLIALFVITPVLANAAFGDVDTFIGGVAGFINNTLIPLLLAVAFLVFVYGVFKFFVFSSSDDGSDSRKEGKQLILWAIIGFVLIVSIWGIINLLSGGLGFDDADRIKTLPDTPKIEGDGS